MKKKLLFYFIFLWVSSNAQNLVYNPSFELFETCPVTISTPGDFQFNTCLGWYVPTGATSDYFNSCNTSIVGVPNNFNGFQNAYEGEAYAGILLEKNLITNSNWFEYIQVKLIDPLVSGGIYHLSFKVNLANDQGAYAIEKIGAMVSENGIWSPPNIGSKNVNFIPQITNSNGYLLDTANWMTIEGDVLANGGEDHLTIGYYSDPEALDTISFAPPITNDFVIRTYYYVDSVTLEATYLPPSPSSFIPNVFTPNNDKINDFFLIEIPYERMTIMNRWGNIVFESTDNSISWNGKDSNGDRVVDGTYFYKIEQSNNVFYGFIQVLR